MKLGLTHVAEMIAEFEQSVDNINRRGREYRDHEYLLLRFRWRAFFLNGPRRSELLCVFFGLCPVRDGPGFVNALQRGPVDLSLGT